MPLNNITWATNDQITLVKQTGMVEDITNDDTDVHEEYVGNQKANFSKWQIIRIVKRCGISLPIFPGNRMGHLFLKKHFVRQQ